jgi:LPXTG-site transpeptidase (sortase) family protein
MAALPDSDPRRIRIPAIGVSAHFVPLDLLASGELSTPSDPSDVGWFAAGRTPGGAGVSVVAGHVTWNGSEAVFFRLGALQRGDHIDIERGDGSTAVFSVQSMDTFPKHRFPTDRVYRNTDEPELVLITCGGDYNANRHHYNANVIVWAKLVGHRRT